MRFPILILFALLLGACGSSKKQLRTVGMYEREGMYEEAFERYAALYARDPKLVEAHVGMKRNAQFMFDRIQEHASHLYMSNDLSGGDKARQEAEAFRSSMEKRGLLLNWDPLLDGRRREAGLQLAGLYYGQATAAFKANRFSEAEELADRCLELDPEHEEAVHLRKLTQLEQEYHKGERAMELKLWKDAFLQFKKVTDRDPGFKEAWRLQNECRQQAAYTIAFIPLVDPSARFSTDLLKGQSIERQLAASIKMALLDLSDPLMMLIDRDNTERLLAEQQRNLSGIYDDRYVADAGKLMGARFVITGKVLRFDDVLRKHLDVQIQLIEVETGRIHLADVVRVHKQDLSRGPVRSQLLDHASSRIAERIKHFDPFAR